MGWLRKTVILLVLAVIWEVYGRWLDNALLFSFSETVQAFLAGIGSGVLLERAAVIHADPAGRLWPGHPAGRAADHGGHQLAHRQRPAGTLTSMFNPLPASSLLPLALIWFGLGTGSIIFVLVHSVLWAVALNTHGGFRAVSNTLRMVGQNYGLRRFSLVKSILIPAAFPSILTGLKVGWAFAWRTLIAAELVFGVSSRAAWAGTSSKTATSWKRPMSSRACSS
jgi:NitT/TauT family transport system permease protein